MHTILRLLVWPPLLFAGLSFASSGVVSGSPSGPPGTVTVTFRVTDGRGQVATKDIPITITLP